MARGVYAALPAHVAVPNARNVMSLYPGASAGQARRGHAISPELVRNLLAWRHPGFCAHVGPPIAPEDKQPFEDTAAHLVRNPLSLKKPVYLDGEKAVVYRSRMNASLGRNSGSLDPREVLARMSDTSRTRTRPEVAQIVDVSCV
jgi:hypothetical protein